MQLSNICTVKLCPDLVFLSDLPYQPEKCKETCPQPRQRSRCVLWCFPQPEYQRPDRSSTSRMTRSCTSVPSAAASQHSVGWQSLLWNKGKQRLSFQQRQPAGFWLLPYHDCVCVCCRGWGGGEEVVMTETQTSHSQYQRLQKQNRAQTFVTVLHS